MGAVSAVSIAHYVVDILYGVAQTHHDAIHSAPMCERYWLSGSGCRFVTLFGFWLSPRSTPRSPKWQAFQEVMQRILERTSRHHCSFHFADSEAPNTIHTNLRPALERGDSPLYRT